jgi:outer membrane protein OmpA-like peptidoglycan-associated protein
MTGIDNESSNDLNVWISFADLFAGLLLIMIIGLVAALHGRNEEDIQFSRDLVRVMNQATSVTKKMQDKLNTILPELAGQTKQSETEIVIPAGALFKPLSYDDYLTDPAKKKLLTAIRDALKQTVEEAGDERKFLRIIIEGHTDSDAIGKAKATNCIPTNWELSSRRATGVLRFFEEGGLNAREYNIVAMGLADTQPVAPNNTEEEKSLNRRIVIRVEPIIEKMQTAIGNQPLANEKTHEQD